MAGERSGKERREPIPFPSGNRGGSPPKIREGGRRDRKPARAFQDSDSGTDQSPVMIVDDKSLSYLNRQASPDSASQANLLGVSSKVQSADSTPSDQPDIEIADKRHSEAVEIAKALQKMSKQEQDKLIIQIVVFFNDLFESGEPRPLTDYSRTCFLQSSSASFFQRSINQRNRLGIKPVGHVKKKDMSGRRHSAPIYDPHQAATMVVHDLSSRNYSHITSDLRRILANSAIPSLQNCLNHELSN